MTVETDASSSSCYLTERNTEGAGTMTIAQQSIAFVALLMGFTLTSGLAVAQDARAPEPEISLYAFDESNRSRTLLDDRWGAPDIRIGQAIAICFSMPQDGWVNLWSISSNGSFDLIYPNAFSEHGGKGTQIVANKEYCIGNDDAFRLRVHADTGLAQVYLNWVATEAELLAPDHYVDLLSDSVTRSLTTREMRSDGSSRVDVYVPYRVVE